MTIRTPSPHAATPLDAAQRATLAALMDLLIPASPDGRMPAARALGLYDDAATLREADRALFDAGLSELDLRARATHGAPFSRLTRTQAKRLVDALRNEGSAFLQSFAAQTVGRYLSHPVVMPLLGLEPRPHWPQGHAVAEGDWSLLDGVRQRGKFYRKV